MIYFDNAATGGYKPSQVYESAVTCMKYLNVNAGHSGHRLAMHAENQVYKTRKLLASFFGASAVERVIFTKNCTEALNLAILGTAKKGGNVIVSVYEHNSVLRPLYYLRDRGIITITVATPASDSGAILASDIERAIKSNTYMVCLSGASNVTGVINDYEGIGALLKDKNIIFLLDAAQAAGHTYIDMQKQNINALCAAGHKGLDAIQGSGCLLFDKSVNISPTFFGGSGTETFAERPSGYPELLECGTLNLPAIFSLYEGVLYNAENMAYKQQILLSLTKRLCENLSKNKNITLYSRQNPAGIVSFAYNGYSSQEIAGVLSDYYDIAVRGGYHCAPLAHKFLHTDENGLVRVSFSEANTNAELDEFIYAINDLPCHLA